MRACWIDAGNNPNTVKLDAHGVTRVYFDATDPRLTPDYLYGPQGWVTKYEVGIYRTPGGLSAVGFAQQLHADLARIGANDRQYRQCAVHVNAEAHDFDLVAFLKEWRSLRPYRQTAWVIEGMQGGRLTSQQVLAVDDDVNLQVLGEAYYDTATETMLPRDPDAVRSNLVNYGVQRKRALVMYDAAKLGQFWDGCAFTQGRLT